MRRAGAIEVLGETGMLTGVVPGTGRAARDGGGWRGEDARKGVERGLCLDDGALAGGLRCGIEALAGKCAGMRCGFSGVWLCVRGFVVTLYVSRATGQVGGELCCKKYWRGLRRGGVVGIGCGVYF